MSEHQWEEIRIEDVQPGDVARCNGREFRVTVVENHALTICAPGMERFIVRPLFVELGCTFWRKVKREPRTFDAEFNCIEFDGQVKVAPDRVLIPSSWHHGTRVRVTEILDGEDGA